MLSIALLWLHIFMISASASSRNDSSEEVSNKQYKYDEISPFWDNPCGVVSNTSEALDLGDINATYYRSLRKIRQHIKMAQQQLSWFDFHSLYVNTRQGLSRDNYNPNWVPDISSVKPILETNGVQTLSTYGERLTILQIDLQKFSIAFEQIQIDEPIGTGRRRALNVLIEYLRELLCEVNITIVELGERLPEFIPRSRMRANERHFSKASHQLPNSDMPSISNTDRMIRDNGILLKYKEFLDAWLKVYKIARKTLSHSEH